jgi:polyisoprenoid-binding protein YceI
MKKIILTTVLAAIGFVAMAGVPKKGAKNQSKVNIEESSLKWHAKKVTGEHFGTIKLHSGEMDIENNQLKGGSFNIDMTSIECTDLTGEWHDKLVNHLKSDDFFSVAKHATASIKITSVTPIKNAKPGSNNYNIKANLTIKGITSEVEFPAMIVITKNQVIANAEIIVDRTKYDVRYGSKNFFSDIGDKAIDNEFSLKVRIVSNH